MPVLGIGRPVSWQDVAAERRFFAAMMVVQEFLEVVASRDNLTGIGCFRHWEALEKGAAEVLDAKFELGPESLLCIYHRNLFYAPHKEAWYAERRQHATAMEEAEGPPDVHGDPDWRLRFAAHCEHCEDEFTTLGEKAAHLREELGWDHPYKGLEQYMEQMENAKRVDVEALVKATHDKEEAKKNAALGTAK